jgi:hypothetical protein
VSQDDDIHVIEKVKGFILPQFYCMKTYHRPNRMQINMPTVPDRIVHACPLPPKTPHIIYRLAVG